jgi:hypothetical protein
MPFTSKTYSCGSIGRVRRLDNLNHGQANWVNVPVPQAVANFITLLDIEVSPNNGDLVFAVGQSTGTLASPQFFGVAVSNNGGVTWNVPGGSYQSAAGLTVNNGNTFQWNEIVVVGPQVYGVSGMSVIVGSVDTTTGHGAIAISNDGGFTYNSVPWYANLLMAPNPPMADKECTAVHFPNTNVGVVALNLPGALDAWVIKTTDGGGTWLILNGQNFLTTALVPNPPGTILPIHKITGISILANQEHIIGVGQDFIVSTESVPSGNPTAGVATDSWRNNFITASGFGPQPVVDGFAPNLPIGWHLGTYQTPDERVIWVSGESKLGIHSTSHGVSGWTTTPAPGWDPTGTGFSRKASHFYNYIPPNTLPLEGFYNKSTGAANEVYWNPSGFSPFSEILSDDLPGLNYAPEAIWTWYNETVILCYTLTDCNDPFNIIYTNTNLLPYIGLTITIVEQPGHCFVVSDGCLQGAPTTPVTYVATFADCLTCAPPPTPCACPQGTTQVTLPDGSIACVEDTVVLAEGPTPVTGCQRNAVNVNSVLAPALLFGPSPQYSRYGAKFYGETSGVAWPINFTTGCAISTQSWNSFPASPLPVVNTVSNTAWGTGGPGLDGRVNAGAGITMGNTPCAGPFAGGTRVGTVFCLNNLTTKTYSFGFMGFAPEILINGIVFVQAGIGSSDIYQYETWTVIQLTLPAGNYIIQMSAAPGTGTDSCPGPIFTFNNPPFTPRNPGSIVGWAFEIYDATVTALAAMTLQAQVDAVLVYSTKNEDGLPLDYGEAVNNYRCPCPLPPALCPDSFGNYNIVKPILDNCTVNPLNPNADPRIYVCHTYKYTALADCCYLLTDCVNPAITHLTSTDLSTYVGQVITVQEYVGCFIVSQVPCGPVLNPPVTLILSYGPANNGGCAACAPKCYLLTDCKGVATSILVNNDLSQYVGEVINIPGSSVCWTVSLANNCQGSISVGTPTANFATCSLCAPVCYLMVNCADPNDIKITSTDLSAYVGQVIYIEGCPGVCWQVNISLDCTGAIPVVFQQAFADCETCNPTPIPPPLELRPRRIKPGYDTPGCDPAYTEKVNCTFGNAVYDQMTIIRYGITMCCNQPIEKWDIKKQLLDLRAIYDPELCKNTINKCCPPCAIVATLILYPVPITCPPPTNVVAVLTVPPIACPAPTNIQVGIIINPTMPCVCYLIIPTNPGGIPCVFSYTNCFGVPSIVDATGPTYVCSVSTPTTLCNPANYTLQTTPGNCANGGCAAPIPCTCFRVDSVSAPTQLTFIDCTGGPQIQNILPGTISYICGSGLVATPPSATITPLPNNCGLGECHG